MPHTAFAALALAAGLAPAGPAAAQVTATHVANAGFLLAAADGKVLIDALFDDGIRGYGRIPDAVRPALEGGEPPFDGVDLALATHGHRDHFGARSVERFLAANPRALFVSTPQAIDSLREQLGDGSPLASRLRAVLPEPGARERIEHRGIRLDALALHHGPGGDPNLGFVVRLGELAVLHVGDTEAGRDDFRRAGLAGDGIDLALVPYWFLPPRPFWADVVEGELRPRHVAVMHLPTRDAPRSWLDGAADLDTLLAAYRAAAPAARLFHEPLERETYAPAR